MNRTKPPLVHILSLTLALALVLGLFAGCGEVLLNPIGARTQTSSDDKTDSFTEEGSESDTTVVSDEGSAEITYPLTEETQTLSFLTTVMTNIEDYINDYNELSYFQYLEELTNVHINFKLISTSAKTEQYQLIFAAEDYSDLMYEMLSVYGGGASAAIDNGVILDLVDLIPQYAPDYYALINAPANEDIRKAIVLDDGAIAGIWGFSDINAPLSGVVVRSDLLDKIGESVPETYDDWTRVLTAFKNELNLESPLLLSGANGVTSGNGGGIDAYAGGFGVIGDFSVNENDQVVYGPATEAFGDYLTLLNQWWNDGLIYSDFATSAEPDSDLITTGKTGIYYGNANTFKNLVEAASEDGFALEGIRKPVLNENDTYHFGDTRLVNKATSISATCAYPEIALEWLNTTYTEEGIIYSNYGLEGEAFEYDENGEPQYTDLVRNNPEGLTEQQARWLYAGTLMPLYSIEERNFASYSEDALEAITNIWVSNTDAAYVYQGDLNVEEAEEYTALFSDIETYVNENVLSFVVGNRDMDEYDEFIDTLYGLGLEDVLALKQAAYDRYSNR